MHNNIFVVHQIYLRLRWNHRYFLSEKSVGCRMIGRVLTTTITAGSTAIYGRSHRIIADGQSVRSWLKRNRKGKEKKLRRIDSSKMNKYVYIFSTTRRRLSIHYRIVIRAM